MKKQFITVGLLAAGIITFIPSVAQAQEANVQANCDILTVTAPENTRVIFSIDAEPPMEVSNGNTASQAFFPVGVDANMNQFILDSHHWFVAVFENDVQTSVQAGDVTGCAAADAEFEFTPGPAPVPTAPLPAEPEQTLNLEIWSDVAISPPW